MKRAVSWTRRDPAACSLYGLSYYAYPRYESPLFFRISLSRQRLFYSKRKTGYQATHNVPSSRLESPHV